MSSGNKLTYSPIVSMSHSSGLELGDAYLESCRSISGQAYKPSIVFAVGNEVCIRLTVASEQAFSVHWRTVSPSIFISSVDREISRLSSSYTKATPSG
jgi:hypothetical protein